MRIINRLQSLWRDVVGQDLIEYGLLAALIAVGSVAVVTASGGSVNVMWTVIQNAIAGVALAV